MNEKNESNGSYVQKRLDYIDMAKGIGILLVIAGHMVGSDKTVFKIIYSFHMPLFFILTGILLKQNNKWASKNFYSIVIGKMRSILWPYFTFSSMLCLVCFLRRNSIPVREIIETVTLFGAGAAWFLPVHFFASLIVMVLLKSMVKIDRRGKLIIISILMMAVFGITSYLCRYVNPFLVNGTYTGKYMIIAQFIRIVIASAFVLLGYGISYFLDYCKKRRILFILCMTVFLVLSLFKNSSDLSKCVIGNPAVYWINSIAGSLIVILFCMIVKKSEFLNYWGKNSLVVMMTHSNFGLLGKIVALVPVAGLPGKAVAFIAVLVMEVGFVWIFNRKQFRWLVRI